MISVFVTTYLAKIPWILQTSYRIFFIDTTALKQKMLSSTHFLRSYPYLHSQPVVVHLFRPELVLKVRSGGFHRLL